MVFLHVVLGDIDAEWTIRKGMKLLIGDRPAALSNLD